MMMGKNGTDIVKMCYAFQIFTTGNYYCTKSSRSNFEGKINVTRCFAHIKINLNRSAV